MAPSTPASILVIDDDRPFARSVQILLEDEGHHEVAVATSADLEPAALAEINNLDVLVIDLAVLDTMGSKLGSELRNLRSAPSVIVMTAHAAALDAAHLRGVDAAGLIAKPIAPTTLLALLSEVIHNRQFNT